MEIGEGLERLTHGVSNFYLLEDGGKVTLVDAGTPGDWPVLIEALHRRSIEPSKIDAVLLTHAHADHTGFAERARTEADARVWIHKADEESARDGDVAKPDGKMGSYLLRFTMYRTMVSLARRGATKIVPIREVSTFGDGEVLDVPGRPRVIHAPGHTAGSCALLMEDKGVLFTGDVFATWNPLTGRTTPQIMPSAMNADTQEAMRSLDALDGISAKTALPGHGDPWTSGVADAVALARQAGVS